MEIPTAARFFVRGQEEEVASPVFYFDRAALAVRENRSWQHRNAAYLLWFLLGGNLR